MTPSGSPRSNMRIAVVARDDAYADELVDLLNDYRYEAWRQSEDVDELLEAFRERPVSVVILDEPSWDVWDVCIAELMLSGEDQQPFILVLSSQDDEDEWVPRGANRVLTKPVTAEKVASVMAKRWPESSKAEEHPNERPPVDGVLPDGDDTPQGDDMRIALVTSDSDFADQVLGALRKLDHFAWRQADSAGKLGRYLRDDDIDAVILDDPRDELWRVCLDAHEASGTETPTLMVLANPADTRRFVDAGANRVLTKPVQLELIEDAFRSRS
jgi:DNA-binding response OmpR family regulator